MAEDATTTLDGMTLTIPAAKSTGMVNRFATPVSLAVTGDRVQMSIPLRLRNDIQGGLRDRFIWGVGAVALEAHSVRHNARLAVDGYSILEGSSDEVLAQHNEELPPDEDPVEQFAEIAGDYPELGSTLMYAGCDLRQEATQSTYVIMCRAFLDAADSTIGRKLRSAPRSIGANAIVWRAW